MSRKTLLALVLTAVTLMGSPPASSARNSEGEPPAAALEAASDELPPSGLVWDARAVEHLYNRAGFGARPRMVERGVAMGQAKLVDSLLHATADSEVDPFFVVIHNWDAELMKKFTPEERQEEKARIRGLERKQLTEYGAWWVDQMISGDDPLRDRMTLFWHGHFTSSSKVVRRTYELLRQNQFVRENAIESFADLLRGIVRDPAMLYYLDNYQNRKASPNENFARELMELFSLGEGNYTEDDIKNAARALTGYASDGQGNFRFNRKQHDKQPKTILGQTGKFNGDDLVNIILAQDACARHIAGEIIAYLEGVAPDDERLDGYAACLREHGYQLTPFLRRLFMDPAFYREQIVGQRVQSPIDYVVGTCRRLNVEPNSVHLVNAAGLIGQRLFEPPNVKGWEEGTAWITTSTIMHRGNISGLLLGVVDFESIMAQRDRPLARRGPLSDRAGARGAARGQAKDPEGMDGDMDGGMDPGMKPEAPAQGPAMQPTAEAKPPKLSGAFKAMRNIQRGWRPNVNFTRRLYGVGAVKDAQIAAFMAEELLASAPSHEMIDDMVEFLAAERVELELPNGRLLDSPQEAEPILRRLAHLVLSRPEAQLN